jgi:membrane fusion protein
MAGSLFRLEAIEFQRKRAWAGVTTIPPVATWLLTGFLMVCIAAAATFLSLGTYARKESVTGYLSPVSGVAKVMPPSSGVVAAVNVADADMVVAGQPLLSVRSERHGVQGQGVDANILANLQAKRDAIADRIKLNSAPRTCRNNL